MSKLHQVGSRAFTSTMWGQPRKISICKSKPLLRMYAKQFEVFPSFFLMEHSARAVKLQAPLSHTPVANPTDGGGGVQQFNDSINIAVEASRRRLRWDLRKRAHIVANCYVSLTVQLPPSTINKTKSKILALFESTRPFWASCYYNAYHIQQLWSFNMWFWYFFWTKPHKKDGNKRDCCPPNMHPNRLNF